MGVLSHWDWLRMRPFLRINPFINLQPENLIPAYIDGEGASGQMLIGYMRVSTNEQSLDLQRDALLGSPQELRKAAIMCPDLPLRLS